jgi:hypothetical protein
LRTPRLLIKENYIKVISTSSKVRLLLLKQYFLLTSNNESKNGYETEHDLGNGFKIEYFVIFFAVRILTFVAAFAT